MFNTTTHSHAVYLGTLFSVYVKHYLIITVE